jgi:hypothetical protein
LAYPWKQTNLFVAVDLDRKTGYGIIDVTLAVLWPSESWILLTIVRVLDEL